MIFLLFALFFFGIHWLIRRRNAGELLLLYLVFFCFGIYGISDFVVDVFYPTVASEIKGWASGNPFEFEAGIANLGFGVLGILCVWFRGGFLLATLIGNTIWLWGDAIGQMIKAGTGLYYFSNIYALTDVIIPFLIWIVYLSSRKTTSQ